MAVLHDVGRFTSPPSLADIEALSREALATIPAELRHYAQNLVIQVTDFPDDETLEEMDCDSPFELLGLYRGVEMTRASVMDAPQDLDMVFLYRRPILDYWCETEENIYDIVRHVLIHEIGHHFGFSDDDMEAIEQRAD